MSITFLQDCFYTITPLSSIRNYKGFFVKLTSESSVATAASRFFFYHHFLAAYPRYGMEIACTWIENNLPRYCTIIWIVGYFILQSDTSVTSLVVLQYNSKNTQHDMVKFSYSYRIPTILCKQVLTITIAKIVLFRKQYLTTSR